MEKKECYKTNDELAKEYFAGIDKAIDNARKRQDIWSSMKRIRHSED